MSMRVPGQNILSLVFDKDGDSESLWQTEVGEIDRGEGGVEEQTMGGAAGDLCQSLNLFSY